MKQTPYEKAINQAEVAWAEYKRARVPVYNNLGPHDDPYWRAQARLKAAEFALAALEGES